MAEENADVLPPVNGGGPHRAGRAIGGLKEEGAEFAGQAP